MNDKRISLHQPALSKAFVRSEIDILHQTTVQSVSPAQEQAA